MDVPPPSCFSLKSHGESHHNPATLRISVTASALSHQSLQNTEWKLFARVISVVSPFQIPPQVIPESRDDVSPRVPNTECRMNTGVWKKRAPAVQYCKIHQIAAQFQQGRNPKSHQTSAAPISQEKASPGRLSRTGGVPSQLMEFHSNPCPCTGI